MREFWNNPFIEESWKVLQKLRKDFNFIVIGGWAVYLLTRAMKSRDIDIIVNFETLEKLKLKYVLNKNVDLRKYEFRVGNVSMDVYVPYFSKFAIPPEKIEVVEIESFRVPKKEFLLVLKVQAEMGRGGLKGLKDRVDILSLLISGINFKLYKQLLKKYKLNGFLEEIKKIVRDAKEEWEYLGYSNPAKIKRVKKELMEALK